MIVRGVTRIYSLAYSAEGSLFYHIRRDSLLFLEKKDRCFR